MLANFSDYERDEKNYGVIKYFNITEAGITRSKTEQKAGSNQKQK